MRTVIVRFVMVFLMGGLSGAAFLSGAVAGQAKGAVVRLKLPDPQLQGEISLEETLVQRRSIRQYTPAPLTLAELSQLLWAAQGTTRAWGGRTAPSAGALYPLELYVVVDRVEDLAAGLYHYETRTHELTRGVQGELGAGLAQAALGQEPVRQAAVNLVFVAIFQRTTVKYGPRGKPYVYMEAGHAAQNACLQATALGLGAVTIGAFRDDALLRVMHLDPQEIPLYIISVGRY